MKTDRKVLFFMRETYPDQDFYWVSTTMIGALSKKSVTDRKDSGKIHEAVEAGDLSKVKALIEAEPALLESRDGNGFTPLHKACFLGKVALGGYLLDKGADVNIHDRYSGTDVL